MRRPQKSNKKQLWTAAEDRKLFEIVTSNGAEKWENIAAQFNNRSGIQCRERWMNHVRPDVVKRAFTLDEDQKLVDLVDVHGTRWALFVRHFPGRSDSGLKNRYFSLVRHGQARKPDTWALEIIPSPLQQTPRSGNPRSSPQDIMNSLHTDSPVRSTSPSSISVPSHSSTHSSGRGGVDNDNENPSHIFGPTPPSPCDALLIPTSFSKSAKTPTTMCLSSISSTNTPPTVAKLDSVVSHAPVSNKRSRISDDDTSPSLPHLSSLISSFETTPQALPSLRSFLLMPFSENTPSMIEPTCRSLWSGFPTCPPHLRLPSSTPFDTPNLMPPADFLHTWSHRN